MAGPGFDVDKVVSNNRHTPSESFEADRLTRENISVAQYPAQIDRAALDVLYGIGVGKAAKDSDFGGTIDRENFGTATGSFYVSGLQELAGDGQTLRETLRSYDDQRVGELAFQLTGLRDALGDSDEEYDVDRAIEAIVEKQATAAIEESSRSDANDGAGLRMLRDSDSTADLIARLFSDPTVTAYATELFDRLPDGDTPSDTLAHLLDSPQLTTPLWDHQRKALRSWVDAGQRGYVNMATATGKTVLGLAAIATRYRDLSPSGAGGLHPVDSGLIEADTARGPFDNSLDSGPATDATPRVLIVAGNDLLLSQWRQEFDTHLDIPEARTIPREVDGRREIALRWGRIEFATSQALLQREGFSQYDLIILDEAHRYSRGQASGGWGDLFERLTEGGNAVLAMSGSIDQGWLGDEGVQDALEKHLGEVSRFDIATAREQGVIADFSWTVSYVPTLSSDETTLAELTTRLVDAYDSADGTLNADSLGVSREALPPEPTTYRRLRSFVKTADARDLRGNAPEFDAFASALQARQVQRWNVSPRQQSVIDIVDKHAPEAKTVVLVQSYEAARELASSLAERYGEAAVFALGDSTVDRIGVIDDFNDSDRGVIIGPGNLLGTGVDMPDAEVAVNVARGGVNPSLVQRIGRVLRNPTGEKQAQFYHVVPTPARSDAVDVVEDGATLLGRAAEFVSLGDGFRETPRFAVDESISDTLTELERGGVRMVERIDDLTPIVRDDARDHFHTIQGLVYDTANEDDVAPPALTSWSGGDASESIDRADGPFDERNQNYEQYRLALGPYRATKAVIRELHGSTVKTYKDEAGVWQADVGDEVAGTPVHETLVEWLRRYRSYREVCDNRDGDGEPGSLPEYKQVWPEPPRDRGVMLASDAAASLGIDYTQDDPIFFPRDEDGVYRIPLGDGRKLTTEGIVGPGEPDEGPQGISVSPVVLSAARDAVSEGRYDDLSSLVEDATGTLLKRLVSEPVPPVFSERAFETTGLSAELSERHLPIATAVVEDESDPFDTVDALVETALAHELAISGDEMAIEISLGGELRAAVSTQPEADPEAFIRESVRRRLQRSQN
ncbi:DEAD/DEAH box helicase [Halorubrum lipolyticum]|uniref:Type III restriction protein res subunit n=1 Tax=Halorubrum lipolyticum DSM 21995 TaxID=1227482 RepID=M0P2H1_9EURY|nr:DEAD/DEAH box helicase family protein [Halorubrum lipolyticum]EMA63739.1 type III restriction protein res subunit [Halorubrum lipolyticum DSM 21995]